MARAGVLRGIDGRVSVNGQNLQLEQYRISIVADDIPALGFEDVTTTAAYDIGDTGVITTTISAAGYWDASLAPHSSPPGLVAGAILTTFKVFVSKSTVRVFTFPEIRVLQCEISGQLRTRVDFSFTVRSNGSFTYAT